MYAEIASACGLSSIGGTTPDDDEGAAPGDSTIHSVIGGLSRYSAFRFWGSNLLPASSTHMAPADQGPGWSSFEPYVTCSSASRAVTVPTSVFGGTQTS